jgi:phosphoglycolate phosphatase
MPRRRAAIFDLDGTLVDSGPAIARALAAVRDPGDEAMPGMDQIRRWIGMGARTLVGRGLGRGGDASDDELAAFRAAYAAQPGTPDDLYPGIVRALAELRDAGIVLGVCTNKPQALSETVLSATGIGGYFAAVVGGDATPRPKPHGDHLRQTLDAMGCGGLPYDFVGDSSIDADAARAAGARFLWASWGYADAAGLANRGVALPDAVAMAAAILGGARA